jgi:processive 1,2-diacylglycerol beta-glucosyltransferase
VRQRDYCSCRKVKKILFATIEAGSGHTMPAVAVHESLQELFPGKYDLRIMDFMREVGCTELDALHKSVWRYLLAHPRLTKSIQALDIITGPLTMWMYRQIGGSFVEKVVQYLRKEEPDLIFCTHYFNSRAVAIARRISGTKTLLVNCLTELFDFNRYWYQGLRDVDYYIVTSEAALGKLLRKRYPSQKIRLFPYPIRNSFFRIRRKKEEIALPLGLEPDRKNLLVSMGGEGIGPVERMLSALEQSKLDLNVLVVCGRNIELCKQLASRYASCRQPRIVPLGLINNIQELIFLADFCFIKPGPATTWEAVSFHKPLILPKSAHLLENENIAFIRSRGLGLYIGNSPRKLVQAIRMMMDSQVLQGFCANYDKLEIDNGADAIALFLDRLLR